MPEGDTVRRTADRLHRALAGAVLTESDLRWPSIAEADLTGATTLEVRARGKHILHRLDTGLTLHSHLRMEGQWSVEATDRVSRSARGAQDVRAVLGTDTWTAVGRRLGMLDLVATRDEGRLVGHLGPDILGADWDLERAVANVLASGTTIGAGLLDQRNVAGIGTMWSAETLFVERVNPWAVMPDSGPAAHHGERQAGPETVEAVLRRAHRFMSASVDHAMQAPTGIRRNGQNMYVHARSGRPCRRCGDTVRVAPIGPAGRERTMFYCPTCQGGLGPTDDGRRQSPMGSGSTPARGRGTSR